MPPTPTDIRTATLSTGPTVAYTDSGPADAQTTVVLSHGFLMDHRMFDAQVAALTDRYRVLTWDERGHGQTSWDGAPFTYWDSAADVLALLDAAGVDRAVLAGMSQGGFLSLRAALLAPERVAGVVLLDSQAGVEDPDHVAGYDAMHHVWTTDGPGDDLAAVIAGIIIGDDPELTGPWIRTWQRADPAGFTPIYRCLMDRDDLTPRLSEVSVPVLVVHGTADQAISMERAEVVAAAVPDCRGLVRIEGGTHAANMTHPKEVNAAIVEFIAGL